MFPNDTSLTRQKGVLEVKVVTQRQSNVLVGSNQNGTQQNEVVFVRYPEVSLEGYRFVLGRLLLDVSHD